MKKFHIIGAFLLVLTFSSVFAFESASSREISNLSEDIVEPFISQRGAVETNSSEPHEPSVKLRAISGAAITFWTQNGRTIKNNFPEEKDLPHLVLRRNGLLTPSEERTLTVNVKGIQVPSPGVTVSLTIKTQNENPDPGSDKKSILVWHDARWITNPTSTILNNVSTQFSIEFTERASLDGQEVDTPTDYFGYELVIQDGDQATSSPLYHFSEEYAFLMESQWVSPLPKFQQGYDAAPEELVVYYYDMIPYQTDIFDSSSQLSRAEVDSYIAAELIPAMMEAYRLQSEAWGFEWHSEWTSYRPEEGHRRLSVALSDSTTWFHGVAPSIGHSGISIKITPGYGENASYSSLTEKLISPFHHELFHNHQRNISQKLSGEKNVAGKDKAWKFFTEGMATFAASAGQPDFQFSQRAGMRDYLSSANNFILEDLNTSYAEINPYHAALYWRFLYEKCGGLVLGNEDPEAGMRVIRQTLETLYSKQVVDIQSTSEFVENFSSIMDFVLQESSCPFQSFEDSQIAFARAIYATRLENSNGAASSTKISGFNDPNDLYTEPEVNTLHYSGDQQTYTGAIASSYGIDFVELSLEASANAQPLTLVFQGTRNVAQFNVQLIKLKNSSAGSASNPKSVAPHQAQTLFVEDESGHLLYVIPEIDISEFDRLGLVITRLDPEEESDPVGEYTLEIR